MSSPVLETGLVSQRVISAEMAKLHADVGEGGTQPRLAFAPYRSSLLRHPTKDLHHADPETIERVRRCSASGTSLRSRPI